MSDDALIGLWFEVGGGLGRTSGQIIGKAQNLYLVRRDGASHLELLQLEDLKSGRFFPNQPSGTEAAPAAAAETVAPSAPKQKTDGFVRTNEIPPLAEPTPEVSHAPATAASAPKPSPTPATESPPTGEPKRRLSDQIRRAVSLRDRDGSDQG